MLKAEVYLWASQQMNGGTGDATTAKNALTEIQTKIDRSKLDLLSNYSEVFDYGHKGNNEIIFTIHNKQNETNLFGGKWRDNMVPQQIILNSYYDMETGANFRLNMNGTIHYPLDINIYNQYDDATIGYPNLAGDNDGIKEVLLRERFKEFMFEGKRWYDLRRFGNDYVYKYTTADKNLPGRLLWPIDSNTMTDNPALNQTKDY